jgi:DNA repair protein RecO (recombination protein O)
MSTEKTEALVLRTTDWSETSRVATLWTRDLGKVRALAKGGRRLRSNFESSLDLLTHCRIVLIRKTSGGLDLLTEAQAVQCFAHLRTNLSALYAGYYLAELLGEGTQDLDPHPALFDEAVGALVSLGEPEAATPHSVGLRMARFEAAWLRELGFRPVVEECASCSRPAAAGAALFSPAAGGIVCEVCAGRFRDRQPLSARGREALVGLLGQESEMEWDQPLHVEIRHLLGPYVTYLLGRRLRSLPYVTPRR